MKKNRFTIWWIFLFCLLVLNCKFSVTSAEQKIEISKMLAFIPDRFNTGCNESELWEIQTGNYGTIIEAGTDCEKPKNAYFEVRNGEKYNDIVINAYSNKSLANVIKISNLKFTRKLMPLNADKIVNEEPLYKSAKTIIFENCKFVNVQHNSKKLKLIFKNCTFTGNVSCANIELENCRIERTQKDAINPLVNYKAKNVFVRDLLYKVTDSGAHVDGVQIFGNKDVLAQNILIENCRFAIPSFQFPGGTAGVNAALMMQLEYGNADGITFKDIMIDCGGPWSPCRSSMPREIPRGAEEEDNPEPLWQKNVVFENDPDAPELVETVGISEENLNKVKTAMRQVVLAGTATDFSGFRVPVAAKTGTAQNSGSDHTTFICFGPYENPEIAIAVVIEHGVSGMASKNIARDILNYYFSIK